MNDSMPRFSIKDLFLSTTLISMAMGCFLMLGNMSAPGAEFEILMMAIGFSLLGAGLLAPLKKKQIGAGVGAGVFLLLFVIAYVTMTVRYGGRPRSAPIQRPTASTPGK